VGVPHRGSLSTGPRTGRILVVTAVPAESQALVGDRSSYDVITAGVGPSAAAAATARALSTGDYTAAWSLGVGGGFAGRCGSGQVAVATAAVAADLGADSPEGFLSLETLGFGPVRHAADASIAGLLADAGLDVVTGEVLTVSTTTGTDERAADLLARHPAAVAEAMEGFGVATAAAAVGVPFAEVRTVSNLVGRRDRSGWDLEGALGVLRRVSAVLLGGSHT
jgi:futalosine hydrolase